MFLINAKNRENEKIDLLRKNGEVPAVFYGAGKVATSISVNLIDFKKIWKEAGESSAVKLELSGGKSVNALIHEVQTDPITDEPMHIDFLVIDMKKKIKVEVPLVFEGVSNAVKTGIGNLVKVLHEVEVEALPDQLPHSLIVDLSKLETLDDQILVSDIKLPTGVSVVNNPTDVVASIVKQVEEKEEAAPVDLSAIEVEKKGKKEEEGSAEGEPAPASE